MRFPLSMPALAAGALLAAVSLTSPALANSGQTKSAGAFEENRWAADAMSSSIDLICPEHKNIFGQSVGNFLMRKDAFDLIWFPMNFDLTKAFSMVGKTKSQSQSKADDRQQD